MASPDPGGAAVTSVTAGLEDFSGWEAFCRLSPVKGFATRKLFGVNAVPSMLATGAGPLAALPSRHLRQNRFSSVSDKPQQGEQAIQNAGARMPVLRAGAGEFMASRKRASTAGAAGPTDDCVAVDTSAASGRVHRHTAA